MAKGRKLTSSKEARKNLINCIIAVIIAIIFLFPIYWILSMSFKSDAESFGKIVTYYSHNFTIDPWVKNFSDREFVSSLKNRSGKPLHIAHHHSPPPIRLEIRIVQKTSFFEI